MLCERERLLVVGIKDRGEGWEGCRRMGKTVGWGVSFLFIRISIVIFSEIFRVYFMSFFLV